MSVPVVSRQSSVVSRQSYVTGTRSQTENRKSKIQNGVTLLELLVAMTIASVLTAAIVTIFTTINGRWGYQAARATAVQQAQLAMDRMAREIHSAISYTPGPDTFGRTDIFTLPADTDANGNYVPSWNNGVNAYQPGTTFHYYLSDATGTFGNSGTALWREYNTPPLVSPLGASQVGTATQPLTGGLWMADSSWSLLPGSSAPLFGSVSSLSFSTANVPANAVRITMTVSVRQGSATSAYTLQRDVYMSNHN